MSTTGISVVSSFSIQSSAVSRVMISRRSGPASTWQWRQVWLQSLPTLIWNTWMPVATAGGARTRQRLVEGLLRTAGLLRIRNCSAAEAS